MANRSGDRIESVISSLILNGINVGKAKSGVYSPKPGRYTESDFDSIDGMDRLREEAIQAFKFLSNGDYTGCFPIVHPWRQCHTDGTTCEDHNCKRQHMWYFSPHVHLIYNGYLKESNQLYHSKKFQGSIFKRISDGGKERDIRATILYLLSHAGIPFTEVPRINKYLKIQKQSVLESFAHDHHDKIRTLSQVNGHQIRYYGIYSSRRAGKALVATQDRLVSCPKCQSEIRKYDRMQSEGSVVKSSVHESPFYLRVNVYQWWVRINGNKTLGIRSAEVDDEPYGYCLTLSQRQKMENSVKLTFSDHGEKLIFHRDPSIDSNWSEYNSYQY
jgi:hypothetical protein